MMKSDVEAVLGGPPRDESNGNFVDWPPGSLRIPGDQWIGRDCAVDISYDEENRVRLIIFGHVERPLTSFDKLLIMLGISR